MPEIQEKKICSRAECQVPLKGPCLDGFDPWTECPYFSGKAADLTEMSPSDLKVSMIRLPEGQPLTPEEAESLMQAERTRVIVVGGATGCGKTTLITSIYESFLDAPFAGYSFSGSATLPGFEQACHEGRITSGLRTPDTKRTNPRLGVRFYHLKLVSQSLAQSRNQLLIADMSGELFRNARDASEEAKKLGVLRRADCLTFLLDGEKLSRHSERAVAYHDARMILRALSEESLFGKRTELQVVFAKWDLVENEGTEIRDYLRTIQTELSSLMKQRVSVLRFFSIAARPEENSPSTPFAFGVAELFREWVGGGCEIYLPRLLPSASLPSSREFAHYGETTARNTV